MRERFPPAGTSPSRFPAGLSAQLRAAKLVSSWLLEQVGDRVAFFLWLLGKQDASVPLCSAELSLDG